MSKPSSGDEGVGPYEDGGHADCLEGGYGEPTFVSGLGKSLHASMSLGMESGL